MKKYLVEMTDNELVDLAKKESILLSLQPNREKLIEVLASKGYEKEAEIKVEEKTEEIKEEVKLTEVKENIDDEFEVKEENIIFERSKKRKSSYRNYPIRKRRKFFENFKKELFTFADLDEAQIKRREVETEINKSKFDKGKEIEFENKEDDIYFDKAFLPNSYFVDEVVLMPKNPNTLFVYWEIREETFEKLIKEKNIVDNIIIKLFKDGTEYKKIVRHERIGSHYISEVDTNQNYEAFVGYEDVYGNFEQVAHSKIAMVPSDKLSDNFDLTWGTVKEDKNTGQTIKYINSPIVTPENIEFLELANIDYTNSDEFTGEILERLLKIGSSEQLLEILKREGKLDRLVPFGSSSLQ